MEIKIVSNSLARILLMRGTLLTVLGAGLLSFSSFAWAQISLLYVTSCGPQAFPASICTIPSTTSGNLVVVAWQATNGGGGTTIVGITDNASGGGNYYSEAGNARAVDSARMADLWYAKNVRPGATVLTITPNLLELKEQR